MKKRKEPSINNLIMHLDNVSKSYKKNDKIINVLKEINVDFYSNNFYAIKGHSGSGKSTLINILGLVDKFDSGIYELYGITATSYNDKTISKLRMKKKSFRVANNGWLRKKNFSFSKRIIGGRTAACWNCSSTC